MPDRSARVAVATGNAGKVREIRAILVDAPFRLIGLDEAGAVDFPDEGSDYRENAMTKARVAAEQTGVVCVADDSGLEVAALGGAPGPLSARYGGPGLDDAGRVAHLLRALAEAAEAERAARFVCFAAVATPEGDAACVVGACEGAIARAPRGAGGFGYDPVFQLADERVMAEVSAAEKNRISHRAVAFRALLPEIVARLGAA